MAAVLDSPTPTAHDTERALDRVISIGLLVAALAALMAGATLWLLLTDPVSLTSAVGSTEVPELALRLAGVIIELIGSLLAYL